MEEEEEVYSMEDGESSKSGPVEPVEDSIRKTQRELIVNNLKSFPFLRGVMAEVNIASTVVFNSVQPSSVQLHSTARRLCARKELGKRRGPNNLCGNQRQIRGRTAGMQGH